MTTDAERREATDQWTIQLREGQLRELRAQLATVTADRDGLALELSHLRPEWQAVTAERDELRLQLGAAIQRADKAAIELLALQVDRSKTVKLRDETDTVIWALKPEDVPGAINWGDLGCREVQEVVNEERRWYRVIIEEADPSNPALHAAVLAGLTAMGWDTDDIELETAW